jgi:sporulation protein YlmC with PRC-barrel domain
MDFSSLQKRGDAVMVKFAYSAILVALSTTVAGAQSPAPPLAPRTEPAPTVRILTAVPADTQTVTRWYKQNVYDPSDNKIGEVMDVLVDHEGKIGVIIVGVGGFVGVGEKDVAVPFNAIQFKTKDNNKWYPVMNTTKDALKTAPGYKYDRTTMMWTSESAPATNGLATPRPETRPLPKANEK